RPESRGSIVTAGMTRTKARMPRGVDREGNRYKRDAPSVRAPAGALGRFGTRQCGDGTFRHGAASNRAITHAVLSAPSLARDVLMDPHARAHKRDGESPPPRRAAPSSGDGDERERPEVEEG